MKARAPGKLVISGAYAVLEGAPALVTAVDRYVVADTARPPDWVAREVFEAIGDRMAPHVDASALRHGERKLGLGSSAAIVVASLAAMALEEDLSLCDGDLARAVWPAALAAHRRAQGGGSGIDVVTSALGATQRCHVVGSTVEALTHTLPSGTHVVAYAASTSCTTASMLAGVRRYAEEHAVSYQRRMDALGSAAQAASAARTVVDFVGALQTQCVQLRELGTAAGVPIVPDDVRSLAEQVDDLAVLPSGAGGGDIVMCVGREDRCEEYRGALEAAGYHRLALGIGARGVHAVR